MYKTVIPMGNLSMITVSQVKNGSDAVELYSQVLAALGQQSEGDYKRLELWARSTASLTMDNIVRMFQQMREVAQKNNAADIDAKVLAEAEWFYCNVEQPGICDVKTSAEINKDVEKRFDITPFYFKPIFYVPAGASVLLGLFLLIRNRR